MEIRAMRVVRLDENSQPDGLSTEADVSTISGCRFLEGQTADVVIVDDPDATARNELRVSGGWCAPGVPASEATGSFAPIVRAPRGAIHYPPPDVMLQRWDAGQRPDWRHWLDTVPEETDDAEAHDDTPDVCWRCDSAPGDTDVGLCQECQGDLLAERPWQAPVVVLTGDYLESADARYTPIDFAERWNVLATAICDGLIPAVVSMSAYLTDLHPSLLSLLTGQSLSDDRRQHAHYARRAGRPRTGKRTRRGR